MGQLIDMTGKRFGKLTVVERAATVPGETSARWRCVCDCGNEKVVYGTDLRRGDHKSCGRCVKIEKSKSAGVKLQYIKNDPDWKQKRERKYKDCPYNDGCRCNLVSCKHCGWNPEVAKARMERMGYGN